MGHYTYPFAGGQNGVAGVGDRWVISFGGIWNNLDTWTLAVTSTSGDFTLGAGVLFQPFPQGGMFVDMATVFVYKERVFTSIGSNGQQWNFSDNLDPTGWEEQNPGAGFIKFLSEIGAQDGVQGFGQLQGRLAVIGRRSIQLWITDADPAQFSLAQPSLDNIGTVNGKSVQQIGDFDVLFTDDTGIRSLRASQLTLNATIDDVGSPIDDFIQAALVASGSNPIRSIVDPKTKNYWHYINGSIFVLSKHPSGKISAWSTYEPRGDDNTLFVPDWFAVLNGRLYVRSTAGGHYVYGGANNSTYDKFSPVTFVTPYLDDKRPGQYKTFEGIQAAMEGAWVLSISADPQSNNYVALPSFGNANSPNELTDSTYDLGATRIPLKGTHFSLKGVSQAPAASISSPAVFGQFLMFYNPSELIT